MEVVEVKKKFHLHVFLSLLFINPSCEYLLGINGDQLCAIHKFNDNFV